MYLWKIDSLVDDFKTGNVSQWEQFKYCFLIKLTGIVAGLIAPGRVSLEESWAIVSAVAVFVFTLAGLSYCYWINSRGDDEDFIPRLVCIGVPAAIRTFAAFTPIYLFSSFLMTLAMAGVYGGEEGWKLSWTLGGALVAPAFFVAYYWYLGTKIRAAASGD